MANALVEIRKVRKDRLDRVADQIVVRDQSMPIDLARRAASPWRCRRRSRARNADARTPASACRARRGPSTSNPRPSPIARRPPAGRVRCGRGRQNDRFLADQQMRAVQLGVAMCTVRSSLRMAGKLCRVGQRDREVAAQADQHLGLSRHASPASPRPRRGRAPAAARNPNACLHIGEHTGTVFR